MRMSKSDRIVYTMYKLVSTNHSAYASALIIASAQSVRTLASARCYRHFGGAAPLQAPHPGSLSLRAVQQCVLGVSLQLGR